MTRRIPTRVLRNVITCMTWRAITIVFPMDTTTSSYDNSSDIEIEAYPEKNKVIVGEELFQELCWAWIETKGPTLLKAIIRENEIKSLRPKYKRQNAFINCKNCEKQPCKCTLTI